MELQSYKFYTTPQKLFLTNILTFYLKSLKTKQLLKTFIHYTQKMERITQIAQLRLQENLENDILQAHIEMKTNKYA